MSRLFILKWKNRAIMDELKYFLTTEEMADVTLACDGQRLKAHKIILAAYSPYFKSLLLENPCQHPIVLLKGVKYAELKAIIEFMYCGEVKISEENLDSLMKTAETLKIKGLTPDRSENEQTGVESGSRHANETENIDDAESSHVLTFTIDLSIWTLTRKQSAAVLSDDETFDPEIKQEPASYDMDLSVPSSNPCCDDLTEHPGEQISHQNPKNCLEDCTLNVTKDNETLTRKKSVDDLNDDEIFEVEIKQEPVPNYMALSVPCSTASTVALNNPSSNPCCDDPPEHPGEQISHQNPKNSLVDCTLNVTKDNLPRPVPSNVEFQNNTEQTCFSVLSSTTENPVSSTDVISDSDTLVADNQQPPSDSSSKKVSSKIELENKEEIKKRTKKSIKTSLNLENQKLSRPVPSNVDFQDNTEQTCFSDLSSTTENPVSSTDVISDSETLVADNQQPPSDSSSKKASSKIELENKEEIKKRTKKPIKTSHNLENRKSQRRSLRQKKIEKDPTKLVESPKITKSVSSDFPKNIASTSSSSGASKDNNNYRLANGWKRIFKCTRCSFKTIHPTSIQRHIAGRHEKLKTFKCQHCDYAASLRQNYKRHIAAVHENVAKFKCTKCPYKCAQHGNLKRHISIVHEGHKPFKCDKCDFRSAQKSHVKKHVLAVHEQRRDFLCSFCTYRCTQKGNLKRHMIGQHGFK